MSQTAYRNEDKVSRVCALYPVLKLINYSCSQKPINDLHLGQVDES